MVKDKYEYLTCYTGVIENKKMYVVHEALGLLIEYNIEDFSYKILTRIEVGKTNQFIRVKGIILLQDIIYLVLENSWNIFEYHVCSKEMKVNGNGKQYIEGEFFVEKIILHNTKIWMFPCYIDEDIRIFDTNTKDFTKSKSIGSYLKECGFHVESMSFAYYEIINKDTIYAIPYRSNYIIIINLNLNEYKIFDIGIGNKIEHINYDGKNFWLNYFNRKTIAKWNAKNGITEEYMINNIEIDERGMPICYIYEKGENLLIIPSYGQRYILFDKKKRKETFVKYPDDFRRIRQNPQRYMFYDQIKCKDDIFFLPFACNNLLKVNIKNNTMQFIETRLCTEDIKKYIFKDMKNMQSVKELYGYGIEEFIHDLINTEISFEDRGNGGENG